MLNKEKGGFPAVRPCGPLWGLFRGRVGYLCHQEVLGRFGPAFAGDIRRDWTTKKRQAERAGALLRRLDHFCPQCGQFVAALYDAFLRRILWRRRFFSLNFAQFLVSQER